MGFAGMEVFRVLGLRNYVYLEGKRKCILSSNSPSPLLMSVNLSYSFNSSNNRRKTRDIFISKPNSWEQKVNLKNYSAGEGSQKSPQWTNYRRRKSVLYCAAILTGGFATFLYRRLNESYYDTVPQESHLLVNSKWNYVVISDPERTTGLLKEFFSRWWPTSPITGPAARDWFQLLEDPDPDKRDLALQKFVHITNSLSSECDRFGPMMSLKTAITLARNNGDPRLFQPLKVIIKPESTDFYPSTFRKLFSLLSSKDIHESLLAIIQDSLTLYDSKETDKNTHPTLKILRAFESSDFYSVEHLQQKISESDLVKICLQGLVSHSRIFDRIKTLLNCNILELLVIVGRDYQADTDIMCLVLKILANISRDKEASAQLIRDTGCLKLLSESLRSSDVKLILPARRALHNLDNDELCPSLPPGIYQLYPEYSSRRRDFDVDVVFIHGLLGGAFRTWRRQDIDPQSDEYKAVLHLANAERESKIQKLKAKLNYIRNRTPNRIPKPEENPDALIRYPSRRLTENGEYVESLEDIPLEVEDVPTSFTQCWPRDWLPQDCPRARIIAVDFESFVTRWTNIAPVESFQRRLHDRSSELLQKLREAGVGDRPVVFVSHSMGGLITKSVLCQSYKSKVPELNKISQQTRGVVFCSVPHFGTHMAVLNKVRRWLLLPTEEIDELSNEGQHLTRLHECFDELSTKVGIKVLSFAEMLETRTGYGMKFKLVSFSSSDLGIGEFFPLPLDHLSTCKPWSRGSFMYKKIIQLVKEFDRVENSGMPEQNDLSPPNIPKKPDGRSNL